MKEASVARSEGALVMDQLYLEDEGRTILSDNKHMIKYICKVPRTILKMRNIIQLH